MNEFRFLLFGFDKFYPLGGFNDLICGFNTINDVQVKLNNNTKFIISDNYQIVDLYTLKAEKIIIDVDSYDVDADERNKNKIFQEIKKYLSKQLDGIDIMLREDLIKDLKEEGTINYNWFSLSTGDGHENQPDDYIKVFKKDKWYLFCECHETIEYDNPIQAIDDMLFLVGQQDKDAEEEF